MSPIDLLGNDIRSRVVTDFLEIRGIRMIQLDTVEDRVHLEAKEQGVEIVGGINYQIDTLFFYAEGINGALGYAGPLPLGVHFGDKRQQILDALPNPSGSGGGRQNKQGEWIPHWHRFVFDSHCVHLQFSTGSDLLEMVTVMSNDAVP